MKKFLILLVFLFAIIISGCTQNAPCYKTELIQSRWSAVQDGGAEIELEFFGEPEDLSAEITITNAQKSIKISGDCLADEQSFVIFDSTVFQNYAFDYIPKGGALELTYNGSTILLQKQV